MERQNSRLQRNFYSNRGKSAGVGHLWHLPDQNAPTGNSKNQWCDLTAIGPAIPARGSAGKVTGRARFAIWPGTDIIVKLENYRSFLDIYDLVGDRHCCRAAQRPGGGMSHER
jgi:hypothetical protein